MTGRNDILQKKLGEMLLAEEKRWFSWEQWGCTFKCSLKVERNYWEITTQEFTFMKENGETSDKRDNNEKNFFLVKKRDRQGTSYILIRFFQGSTRKICTVPGSVEYVQRGSFSSAQNLEAITFENRNVTIEEGAFMYCGQLSKICINGSRKYKVCSRFISPGDQFLYDTENKTILRYLPTAERREAMYNEIHLLHCAKSIGAGAFSGFGEMKEWEIYFNQGLERIGWNAFSGCPKIQLRGELTPSTLVEISENVSKTWAQLKYSYPKSSLEIEEEEA